MAPMKRGGLLSRLLFLFGAYDPAPEPPPADPPPAPAPPPDERRDSFGRLCVHPDPVGNPMFTMYAERHGIEAARAAFGLWESDPYA